MQRRGLRRFVAAWSLAVSLLVAAALGLSLTATGSQTIRTIAAAAGSRIFPWAPVTALADTTCAPPPPSTTGGGTPPPSTSGGGTPPPSGGGTTCPPPPTCGVVPPPNTGSGTTSPPNTPSISISGGPASGIVLGTGVSLTATAGGGTAPYSFNWSSGTASTTSPTSTDTDTPSAVGDATYVVTVTDGAGCGASASTTVHVYDFTLSLSPPDETVLAGTPASYTVSAGVVPGSTGAPASLPLSISGAPATVSAAGSIALPGTSAVSVNTTTSTLGDFTISAGRSQRVVFPARDWTNVSSFVGTAPSSRSRAAMAYDGTDGYTVLFGGSSASGLLADTWTFNGSQWSQLNPGTSPPARSDAAIAYDAADGYVLLYGGTGCGYICGDTWAFKGGQWSQLAPSSSPAPRTVPAMTYDAADGYVVLHGGNNNLTYYADTWTFRAGQWTQLAPVTSPSARAAASMAYDAADGYVVMFGGSFDMRCVCDLDDTWRFVGGSWSQLAPTTSPSSRYTYSFTYDAALNAALFFGGWNANGGCGNTMADTWQFSGGNWTQLPTTASPSVRKNAAMAYDPHLGGALLFGGDNATCGVSPTFYSDTWALGGSAPAGRTASAGLHVYDFAFNVAPPSQTVTVGGGPAAYTVSTTLATGSTGVGLPSSLGLSISGLPASITPTLASSTTLGGSAPLSLAIGSTPSGSYNFTVTGSVPGGSRSASGQLLVSYSVCVLYDQTQVHKTSSTVPIKLQLCDANGANLSSPSITVHAVNLHYLTQNVPNVTPTDSGNANPDNDFRFDGTIGAGGGYIYNLSTMGLAAGQWALGFTAGGDPTLHTVQFILKDS